MFAHPMLVSLGGLSSQFYAELLDGLAGTGALDIATLPEQMDVNRCSKLTVFLEQTHLRQYKEAHLKVQKILTTGGGRQRSCLPKHSAPKHAMNGLQYLSQPTLVFHLF